MPIGINEWRAGIVLRFRLVPVVTKILPIESILVTVLCSFAYLYLLTWLSVLTLPLSLMIDSLLNILPRHLSIGLGTQGIHRIYVQITSYAITTVYFVIYLLLHISNTRFISKVNSNCLVKTVSEIFPHLLYALLLGVVNDSIYLFPLDILLLLAGDIELNPGPQTENCLRFFHWNLNGICARNGVKIPLIEAYNSLYKYDVFAVSESMLDRTVRDEEISIEGLSKEMFRYDHPRDSKVGGVCMYFREGLPIQRRKDLELLQEIIVADIKVGRKKISIVTVYRSPSQNSEQFEVFIDKLQMILTRLRQKKPTALIITGDFNSRSSQWWEGDNDFPEGTALEEFIETNNLYQLINEPTNIRCESMSCIDLIITDQPNLFLNLEFTLPWMIIVNISLFMAS